MTAEVAVIVPVHNASGTLQRTLDALDGLRHDGEFEVVFVDDASQDASAALLVGRTVVRLPEQSGPAAARNAGVAATTAPLLAFTDADCEPEPGWLKALVGALGTDDLVMGPVLPDPQAVPGPFDRTLRITARSPRFETANLAVRREVFERVGGFEPLAAVDDGHFGEDALFGWRAVRHGARVAFTEDAVVHHAVFERDARGYLAERHRLRFFPWLVREAPELRRDLTLRVFLGPRAAAFDLAVAATVTALASRRVVPLIGLLPYARSRAWLPRQLWRRSVVRVNLALVAGDAIGLLALLRGSVAARRIVL